MIGDIYDVDCIFFSRNMEWRASFDYMRYLQLGYLLEHESVMWRTPDKRNIPVKFAVKEEKALGLPSVGPHVLEAEIVFRNWGRRPCGVSESVLFVSRR